MVESAGCLGRGRGPRSADTHRAWAGRAARGAAAGAAARAGARARACAGAGARGAAAAGARTRCSSPRPRSLRPRSSRPLPHTLRYSTFATDRTGADLTYLIRCSSTSYSSVPPSKASIRRRSTEIVREISHPKCRIRKETT